MIQVKSLNLSPRLPVTLATSVHRDLEVGRYDHVPQGATWLRALADEAARIAQVPMATVNLMKSTTQRTVAAAGSEANLVERKDSMCDAIIDAGHRIHVADASTDERWAHNPFVDGRRGRIRFYGAHPLVSPTGFVVGTLCVLDLRPRELEPQQIAELDRLATRVTDELEESRLAALRAGIRRLTGIAGP